MAVADVHIALLHLKKPELYQYEKPLEIFMHIPPTREPRTLSLNSNSITPKTTVEVRTVHFGWPWIYGKVFQDEFLSYFNQDRSYLEQKYVEEFMKKHAEGIDQVYSWGIEYV